MTVFLSLSFFRSDIW